MNDIPKLSDIDDNNIAPEDHFTGLLVLPNYEAALLNQVIIFEGQLTEDAKDLLNREQDSIWENVRATRQCKLSSCRINGSEILFVKFDLGFAGAPMVALIYAKIDISSEKVRIPINIAAKFLEKFRSITNSENGFSSLVHLSKREQETLQLSASGLSSKRIAYQLELSQRTVENHLYRAIRKLKAFNKSHAIAKAAFLGLLDF